MPLGDGELLEAMDRCDDLAREAVLRDADVIRIRDAETVALSASDDHWARSVPASFAVSRRVAGDIAWLDGEAGP